VTDPLQTTSPRPTGAPRPENLTSGRLLARNTLLNLGGEAAPFLVAAVAIPVLIHGLGVDRYGVLTLSMLVVGYFGLFDFGLGRAATRLIAEAAGGGDEASVPGLFWTSLYMMAGFGVIGGVLVAAMAPWLVSGVLKIPPALRGESLAAFYLLALSMPFVISGGSLSGTLSAFQRFDLINAIRVPTGIFSYLGPLAILPFSDHLGWIVAILVAGRIAGWLATLFLCLRVTPSLRRDLRPRRATAWPMLTFGGWVTISNALVGVMSYFDRFFIGAMVSMAAVAYYTVPFQVTSKLGIVWGAMGGVVFAAFSATSTGDPGRAAVLFERANRYIMLALFPLVLLIVTLAPEGLTLWLGGSFAAESATAMRWLALGVFVNTLAWSPEALIQAADRPDVTAIVQLALAPLYVLVLWLMLTRYGIAGAAFAWALRATMGAATLFAITRRVAPLTAPGISRLARYAASAVVVIGLGALPMDLALKGLFLAVTLGLFAVAAWTVLLEPAEREFVRGYARSAGLAAVTARE
jgi:O-antigen/teichoic acid export membrane protein